MVRSVSLVQNGGRARALGLLKVMGSSVCYEEASRGRRERNGGGAMKSLAASLTGNGDSKLEAGSCLLRTIHGSAWNKRQGSALAHHPLSSHYYLPACPLLADTEV